MSALIVIPARYQSTRFPGKPLVMIAGKTMLQRVIDAAKTAIQSTSVPTDLLVATDDQRILQHAETLGVPATLTPSHCATGSDRCFAAVQSLPEPPEYVINLQGDAPLTPPHFIQALLDKLVEGPQVEVVTPVVALSWEALETLRNNKQSTPHSGTTVIVNQGKAVWFSKNIIPAIRNEAKLRTTTTLSPVFSHIGLYGYRLHMLQTFVNLPRTHYEQLEELEQLRLLEHGYDIHAVKVDYQGLPAAMGVDTPEDAQRVEALIKKYDTVINRQTC
jgi:3-deoxy-manno-octulosonate cytidylyltransferase (CMP-KDO synthetase)